MARAPFWRSGLQPSLLWPWLLAAVPPPDASSGGGVGDVGSFPTSRRRRREKSRRRRRLPSPTSREVGGGLSLPPWPEEGLGGTRLRGRQEMGGRGGGRMGAHWLITFGARGGGPPLAPRITAAPREGFRGDTQLRGEGLTVSCQVVLEGKARAGEGRGQGGRRDSRGCSRARVRLEAFNGPSQGVGGPDEPPAAAPGGPGTGGFQDLPFTAWQKDGEGGQHLQGGPGAARSRGGGRGPGRPPGSSRRPGRPPRGRGGARAAARAGQSRADPAASPSPYALARGGCYSLARPGPSSTRRRRGARRGGARACPSTMTSTRCGPLAAAGRAPARPAPARPAHPPARPPPPAGKPGGRNREKTFLLNTFSLELPPENRRRLRRADAGRGGRVAGPRGGAR